MMYDIRPEFAPLGLEHQVEVCWGDGHDVEQATKLKPSYLIESLTLPSLCIVDLHILWANRRGN
jgi:hypothetical protein